MSTTTRTGSARERLLEAAEELFYEEGVHTVGIDRVIERAGVAKASLYSIFGSKEELVRAYLTRHSDTWRARLESEVTGRFTGPREQLLGVFEVLGERHREPDFHGCAFVSASAETRPGSLTEQASDRSRAWLRDLFADLAGAAGAARPEALARTLTMLYHGANLAARMDRDLDAADTARAAAATLLDQACAAGT